MNQLKQHCLCALMLALAVAGRGQSSAPVNATGVKTKVTEIDVVNQNIDRTEMTIAVEYQYAAEDAMPKMGVEVASAAEPKAGAFFSSSAASIGHDGRNFVMFPVKIGSAAQTLNRETLTTDKVRVYLEDAAGGKHYVYEGAMILTWHVPGEAPQRAERRKENAVAFDSFKQNDSSSGYATVRYNLGSASSARLRLKVYDSATPGSDAWLSSVDVDIKSGPGLAMVRVAVLKDVQSPTAFKADTVEVQMIDKKKRVLAGATQKAAMSWVKP